MANQAAGALSRKSAKASVTHEDWRLKRANRRAFEGEDAWHVGSDLTNLTPSSVSNPFASVYKVGDVGGLMHFVTSNDHSVWNKGLTAVHYILAIMGGGQPGHSLPTLFGSLNLLSPNIFDTQNLHRELRFVCQRLISNEVGGAAKSLGTTFPSDLLCDFVVRSCREMQRENDYLSTVTINQRSHDLISDSVSPPRMTLDRARMLISENSKGLLATIGTALQKEGRVSEFRLTTHGHFSPSVADALLSRIPVLPHEHSGFLVQIAKELTSTARSGSYEGSWGKLALREGELTIAVTPAHRTPLQPWTKATPVRRSVSPV